MQYHSVLLKGGCVSFAGDRRLTDEAFAEKARPPRQGRIIAHAHARDSIAQHSSNLPTVQSCYTIAAIMALSIDQKRLKATKFPPEFDRKVDIEKVNIDLMKKWIAQKITDILGDEDDIVVETCYNLIEQNQHVRTTTRPT